MSVKAFFLNLFRPGETSPPARGRVHPDEEALNDEVLRLLPLGARRAVRYPPFIEGFPAYLTSEYLLSLQDDLYCKLLGGVGLPYAEFNRLVRPVILNYVQFVHLLPASENHHHSGPGGLLRHGLEVAFLTMNGAKNKAFDARKTPSQRSQRSIRWYVAGLLTGLLHDTGKALTDMSVVYPQDGLRWLHSDGSIEDWAKKHNLAKYYIEWQKGRHAKHMAVSRDLVLRLVPDETLSWLRIGGDDIYYAIVDAISGEESSPLYQPLMQADGKSTQQDMATGDSPQYMTGVPVVKLLMNAMTRLLQDEVWKVNEPGARLWSTTQGVFIAWSSGAKEVIDLLLEDRIEAIPRTANSLLIRLVDENIAEPSPSGDLYWEVAPDCIQKSEKPLILRCMKLADPDHLFTYSPVPPPVGVRIKVGGELVAYPAPGETAAAATAPAADQPATTEVIQSEDSSSASTITLVEEPADGITADSSAPEPASDGPSAETDEVLVRLAEISISSLNEEDRQDFLDKVLPCFNAPAPLPPDIKLVEAEAPQEAEGAELTVAVEEPAQPTTAPQRYTLDSILKGEPKAKRKSRQKKKTIANADTHTPDSRPEKPVLKQEAPESAAEPETASSSAGKDMGAEISPQFSRWILTSDEQSALQEHPQLAEAILSIMERPEVFSVIQSRVFVPADVAAGGFPSELIPLLNQAGWLWHDFTLNDSSGIFVANRREGVVLADWLGRIVARNAGSELEAVQELYEEAVVGPAGIEIVDQALKQAQVETLPHGLDVLTVTRSRVKNIAEALGHSAREGYAAIHSHRNAVCSWKTNRFYIMPLDGEVSAKRRSK